MVGANLERLLAPHNEPNLAIVAVPKQSDVASAALLPLSGLLNEPEQLGAHLEDDLLRLLMRFGLHLLGQFDHGLEVDILGLGRLVILLFFSWGQPTHRCKK
jgi:hypothetical protein